jgi:hypothetical protein
LVSLSGLTISSIQRPLGIETKENMSDHTVQFVKYES